MIPALHIQCLEGQFIQSIAEDDQALLRSLVCRRSVDGPCRLLVEYTPPNFIRPRVRCMVSWWLVCKRRGCVRTLRTLPGYGHARRDYSPGDIACKPKDTQLKLELSNHKMIIVKLERKESLRHGAAIANPGELAYAKCACGLSAEKMADRMYDPPRGGALNLGNRAVRRKHHTSFHLRRSMST